jgi:hypothetical protein
MSLNSHIESTGASHRVLRFVGEAGIVSLAAGSLWIWIPITARVVLIVSCALLLFSRFVLSRSELLRWIVVLGPASIVVGLAATMVDVLVADNSGNAIGIVSRWLVIGGAVVMVLAAFLAGLMITTSWVKALWKPRDSSS